MTIVKRKTIVQENEAEEVEVGIYSADKIFVLFMPSSFTSKLEMKFYQTNIKIYISKESFLFQLVEKI